ncbi:MAG: threonine/serine dehydratase [Roseiarcus sp.]|jgi:threonine dehydratase
MTFNPEPPQTPPTTVGQAEIRAAHARIAAYVRRTPILEAASPLAGAPPISLKLEFLQHSGSFKPRGAFHNLLTRRAPAVGCATASGGNHGAAVAYAAGRLGVKARIFVPEIAAPVKIAKIKAYGAEIVVKGATYFDAQALCDAYVAESGALAIHPYASPETIAGQGTVGLEWEEDLGRLGGAALETILVAVGGGGLIAGVAAWFARRAKIVGVEPEGSCALHAALAAGRPVDVSVKSVAADSLGSRNVGELNLAIAQRAVDRVALVTDEAIRAAQLSLWREFSIVAEPGGAAAYSALASGAYRPAPGERVGVLVCGANADLSIFAAPSAV